MKINDESTSSATEMEDESLTQDSDNDDPNIFSRGFHPRRDCKFSSCLIKSAWL